MWGVVCIWMYLEENYRHQLQIDFNFVTKITDTTCKRMAYQFILNFRHENHRHHLQTHGLPIDFDFVTKSIETPCKRRILSICLIFRALFQCNLDQAAARSATERTESRGCSGANGARPRPPSSSAGYALPSLGQIL